MSRFPVVLVALLFLAVPATAVHSVGGPTSTPTTSTPTTAPTAVSPNATSTLHLGNGSVQSFVTPNTTVTTTVGVASAGLDSTFSTGQLDARWTTASNNSERRAVLHNATATATNRTDALVAAEASARHAYVAGRLSAHALVQRLALNSARAKSLLSYINAIRGDTNSLQNAGTVRSRLDELRGHLAAYKSDNGLRARLAAAITGNQPPLRVFVAASGNGLSLSALDGGVYYRTIYRTDNYHNQSVGRVDLSWFTGELKRLYPTAWNLSSANGGSRSYSAPAGAYLYKATFGYTRGSHRQSILSVYFNPSTHAVYREDKRVYTNAIIGGPLISRTHNNTTLRVNRTYAGGPLRVSAVNATGAPLAVSVSLNGGVVGTTNPNTGELWLVSPGGSYTVSTTRNGTTVSLNTSVVSVS